MDLIPPDGWASGYDHVLRHPGKATAQLPESKRAFDQDADNLYFPFAGNGPNGSLKAEDVDRLRARASCAIVFIVGTCFDSLVFHTGSGNSSYLWKIYNSSILRGE